MSLGEIAFYIAILLIVIVLFSKLFKKSHSEKEYERKMKERLSDDTLYDPETGATFTLEQAEKGTWVAHTNDSRIKSREEIEKYFDDSEKAVEEISNYLKASNYKFSKLKNNQIEILEKTVILEKYTDWSYSNSYISEDTKFVIFFPKLSIENGTEAFFNGHQPMFWLKINNTFGHYYLREKEVSEKIFDLIRNDDVFKIKGFEVFTIKETKNLIPIIKTLKPFEGEKNLEIEIQNDNLFLKIINEPNMEDFIRLEEKIKNVY